MIQSILNLATRHINRPCQIYGEQQETNESIYGLCNYYLQHLPRNMAAKVLFNANSKK